MERESDEFFWRRGPGFTPSAGEATLASGSNYKIGLSELDRLLQAYQSDDSKVELVDHTTHHSDKFECIVRATLLFKDDGLDIFAQLVIWTEDGGTNTILKFVE